MGSNYYYIIIATFFCAGVCSVNGLKLEARKQCCSLGTDHSSQGSDCKSFVLPSGEVDPRDEKLCISVADVCCKKHYREQQCDNGKEDAKNGKSCSAADGERKVCCESCQTGIESGKAKEPCEGGLGLGSPFDEAFESCCKDAFQTTSTSTSTSTTTSTTTETTFTSEVLKSTSPNRDPFYASFENICDSDVCAQICEPTADSFKCDCIKGFILMEDGISCKPQKRSLKKGGRCEINNPCEQDCTDTGTAIKCSCRQGYQLTEDNKTCKDIDECALNLHDCKPTEECINEMGTYSCYDSTFPELEPVDFEKKCPTGYRFNLEKLVCDDIDECQFELMCIPPKVCKNTIGSFKCEGEDTPQCPPGFYFKAAIESCADIDECINGENDCNKESQVCLNTKGNYTCIDKASRNSCPPGFKKNTFTQLCEDIDECEEDTELCKENEECVNEPGGHTCLPLLNPQVSKKTTPTTSTPSTTTTTTTTTTTETSNKIPTIQYQPTKSAKPMPPVTCPNGYKFLAQTNACVDIDECAQDPESCDSVENCVNTIGSFQCNCKTGYTKDSLTGACVDVNECQVGTHDCRAAERCDNTIGSYHCSRIFGCGTGYTLNYANSLCEDDDECVLGTHNCKELGPNFKCRNILGSYRCDPVRPKSRLPPPTPPKSYLTPFTHPNPQRTYQTPVTQSTTTTLAPTTTPIITTTEETPSKTNSNPPKTYPNPSPNYPNPPLTYPTPPPTYPTPPRKYPVPTYTKPPQKTYVTPFYVYPVSPVPERTYQTSLKPIFVYPIPNRIYPSGRIPPMIVPTQKYPVISGQLKKCLPGYIMNARGECVDIDECENNPCGRHEKCLNFNGRYECASPMQCKLGYELNDAGDQCIDVNECSRGTHKCNPTQICKNGQGYYTCECPPGHHLSRITEQCEDMDECKFFRPCGTNSDCINTKGSYKCECKQGFRKIGNYCENIDECRETPGLCEHNCVNTWGSYRCSCNPGFTLNNDNRTCNDVDECERFKDRRLCIGTCKNVPGSYTCECPRGYKLGSDGRVCLDVDECEAGNVCMPDDICFNTRGSYKCYSITCPANYVKDREHKARCKRLQSYCDTRDYKCLLMPEQYTYQYMTLVSNLPLSEGHIHLFQIKGPQWHSARAEFTLKLLDVTCPYGIEKVQENFFQKINNHYNSMQLYLVRPIQGPQEIKLQIEMRLFQNNVIAGNVVVYIIIVVSEYPF